MEHNPHHPEGGEHHHETAEPPAAPIYDQLSAEQRIQRGITDASDDDPEQATIEAARAAASRERRADRARLEHYVAAGLDPGDAEALIEFGHLSRQQRTEWAGTSTEPTEHEPAPVEVTPEQETTPRPSPRIFLADASPGRPDTDIVRGLWCDAAVDEQELEQAVHELLRSSPMTEAKAYRIGAAIGFQGFEVTEHESLATVARVARGIVAHGRAFAAYARWRGTSQEAVDQFDRAYQGSWANLAAWGETVASELGWPQAIEAALTPELSQLLPYVQLDYARLARDMTGDAHVIEDDVAEAVYVFRLTD